MSENKGTTVVNNNNVESLNVQETPAFRRLQRSMVVSKWIGILFRVIVWGSYFGYFWLLITGKAEMIPAAFWTVFGLAVIVAIGQYNK